VVATGCTQKGGGEPVADPASSARPAGAASGTATPTPHPPAVALPESCSAVLVLDDFDHAVGRFLAGQTQYIKGQGEPKINRIGRVTCRYAVHKVGPATVIPVEVGISSYTDATSATDRMRTTIDQERATGASRVDVTVTGVPAVVLLAADSSSLVLARGTLTLAITITKDVAPADKAEQVLTALATAALGRLS
jgi:hypothetical protein